VVLLTQRDGTMIAAVDPGMARLLDRRLAAAGAGIEHAAGDETVTLADGVERIAGYELVSGSPWLLVAGIALGGGGDHDEAPAVTSHCDALANMAMLLAWIVRRVVVPINLTDGARSFAAGFLNRRVPLQRNDELGQLANSLNLMAASLERRIEEEAAHARALQDLNRLQAEFVATASHELRTPVTAIRTYAEALLRQDIADPQTRRECLEGIDRASERLVRLARSLLDVSRIDRPGARDPEPVPVDQAIEAAAVKPLPADGGEVVLDLPPDLPPVLADADRRGRARQSDQQQRKFSPLERR
jgi:signal transduction histidine kinase